MKWLAQLWSRIRSLFRGAPRPYRVVLVEDVPEVLQRRTVYLVGEGEHFWVAAMSCPCECGETIQLNLLAGQRPRWTVVGVHEGLVSLRPSVWRTKGCRSHFFVKNGQIEWCKGHSETGLA